MVATSQVPASATLEDRLSSRFRRSYDVARAHLPRTSSTGSVTAVVLFQSLLRHHVPTALHGIRTGEYAASLAKALELSPADIETIRIAATLHDIGKVALDRTGLHPESALGPMLRRDLERHPEAGYALLRSREDALLTACGEVARTHHERWNGSGTPHGLRGHQIPLTARVIAIADVFDNATQGDATPERAMAAVKAIGRGKGTLFDPICTEAFLQLAYAGGDQSPMRLAARFNRAGAS